MYLEQVQACLKKKINKETEKSKYFFLAAIDYV